jgi:hypothetical protein
MLYNVYSLENIISVIKLRIMRLAKRVARMGEMKNTYTFSLKSLKGRDNSEDLCQKGG